MKRLLLLLFIFFSALQLNAQRGDLYKDVVYLKNNSKIYGQLIDYKIGEEVKIKLSNGQLLVFSEDVVKKIEIFSPDEIRRKARKEYRFDDNVLYGGFGLKIISGSRAGINNRGFRAGYGIDANIGYRYNNFLSLGIGTSAESYGYGLNENFFPIYFDFISFLRKSDVSPFVRFQAGYGFVKTGNENVIEAEGGLTYNPAFGLKYPGEGNLNYMLDISFKYQKAYFVYKPNRRGQQISYRDVIFRRIAFRFSIVF